jgi:phosphatidylglycerol---prolipoprotein diacylglyceryl transferase
MKPLFIDWQPNLDAIHLGTFGIKWYSLMWAVGLVLAYLIVRWLYRRQKIADEKFDPLFFYCFIGILVGARLGHCLFYEPDYYLGSTNGFIEMLLPIKIMPDGDWKFRGYAGLASHGGALGCLIGMWIYSRRNGVGLTTVLDNVCIATPLTACCIRIGNLMNSEIIGKTTDVPWAFIFHSHEALVDGVAVPRHPAQLYEALAYLIIFLIGIAIYIVQSKKADNRIAPGTCFHSGLCLALIFTFRFFIEFIKKEQVDFEKGMALDMGQLLSLPFIIAGIALMVRPFVSHRSLHK